MMDREAAAGRGLRSRKALLWQVLGAFLVAGFFGLHILLIGPRVWVLSTWIGLFALMGLQISLRRTATPKERRGWIMLWGIVAWAVGVIAASAVEIAVTGAYRGAMAIAVMTLFLFAGLRDIRRRRREGVEPALAGGKTRRDDRRGV